MAHVIVVGSGVAGLIAAIEASRDHHVTLVTKSVLVESNTHYAQGGMAVVSSDEDSVQEHIHDTIEAGAGLCWEPAVSVLCSEGPQRLADLVAWGVSFDREGTDFARGLEAAHSHSRVLHAGGDATGAQMSEALVAAVRATATAIFENTFLADIEVEDNRVRGVHLLSADGMHFQPADVVILASGGAGQLYRHTTNPLVTTGDGVAAAFRAGAVLADVEFYQFHPTALAVPGSFLISEAVRGEGAVLIDNKGERFMQKIDLRAELAPRDVVARGIQQVMLRQSGEPVLLDATALGEKFLNERFPSLSAACRSYGLNWAKQPIPVTPAAHYWMGGIATDTFGRSSIEGLFAVGEVSCTGAHGANRLASNSLLESVVFAHRAVSKITEPWPENPPQVRWEHSSALEEIILEEHTGEHVVDRVELQTLMWDSVGLARTQTDLENALAQFSNWRPAPESHRTYSDWEDANLLLLAQAVTTSARAREESRGAHYRLDYPDTLPQAAHPITVTRQASHA